MKESDQKNGSDMSGMIALTCCPKIGILGFSVQGPVLGKVRCCCVKYWEGEQ